MKKNICHIFTITLVLLFSCCFSVSADSAEWITYIQSGKPFTVVFDLTHKKFDDSIYSGNWKTDPMGNLKGGERYSVYFRDNGYTCKGLNQDKKKITSWTTSNASPADNLISLWGFSFVFDGKGRLYDSQHGLVGHLEKSSDETSSTPSQPTQTPGAQSFSYREQGNYACYGQASYPEQWKDEAICNNLGCDFGKMNLNECLNLADRKGAKVVIYGVGSSRKNECWLQNSCGDRRVHNSFMYYTK